jgi:hypothetical protein
MPAFRFEKEGNVTHIINKLGIKQERLNDTTINVIYDKQYEESAKRYIYYYMYGISYISKSYLKFREKSIRDILEEKL